MNQNNSSDLSSNISACMQLASVISSTLGPCGMDKLLTDDQDHILVSNDGATLVKHLSIQHPAALLLTQVSQSQDDQVGDGTTSVLLFCSALLSQALELIENRGVHASHVIAGYRKCLSIAQKQLSQYSIPILIQQLDESKGVDKRQLEEIREKNDCCFEDLMHIARTTIGSKVINTDSDHFVSMVVNCAIHLHSQNSRDSFAMSTNDLFVHKVIGPSISQSILLDGCIIRKKLPISCPQVVSNAKIMVCKLDSLASARTKFHNAQISVKSYEEANDINAYEKESLISVCDRIIDSGVNVVFNSGHAIHPLAQNYMFRKGVMCAGHVDYRTAHMIATVTGATIQSQIPMSGIDMLHVGLADCVQQVILSDERVIQISGCTRHQQQQQHNEDTGRSNRKPWSSILLRAPTMSLLDECERSVHDAMCILIAALNSKKYVGGGGCMYIHIAQSLRSIMMEQSGVIQLVMEAYAQALEVIPVTLARNAGLQSSHLIAELRSQHSQFIKDGKYKDETYPFMALDLNKGSLCVNVARELKVIEPISVMRNILDKSMDAAEAVIRIDRNIYLLPIASASEMGL